MHQQVMKLFKAAKLIIGERDHAPSEPHQHSAGA
jgi:hypothetical protein